MENCFQAIYEHGVLRPLEPVSFQESEVVSLAIQRGFVGVEAAQESQLAGEQREALLKFVAKNGSAARR